MTDDEPAGDDVSPDGPPPESTEGGTETTSTRRWLVRLLVGLGIGIPVAIEGATFVGLIKTRLFGGDEDSGPSAGTATETGVGVGEELLPATAPTETIRDARLVASGEDAWTFVLSVAVDNATDFVYELRLGTLTNAAGEEIDGGGTTGQIQPGETASVTGTWEVPPNVRPDSVDATAIIHGGEGVTPSATTRSVTLGRVHVEDPPTTTPTDADGRT